MNDLYEQSGTPYPSNSFTDRVYARFLDAMEKENSMLEEGDWYAYLAGAQAVLEMIGESEPIPNKPVSYED